MSQSLAQICRLLIEDIYGPFLSEIFGILTTYGRLPVNTIAQRCRLPLQQVRSGLAALVQLRLVYHQTPLDGPTTYEANTKTAYNLIRTGTLAQLAHRRFGRNGAQIIKKLGALGQTSIHDLIEILHSESFADSRQSNGSDTEMETDAKFENLLARPSLRKIIERLLDAQYIVQLRGIHFQTWSDARQEAEVYIRSSELPTSVKGKQAQQLLEDKVEAEMKRRLEESPERGGSGDNTQSLKRPAIDDVLAPAAKRVRSGSISSASGTTHGSARVANVGTSMPDDSIVCVNFGKAADALYDDRLTQKISSQFGIMASHVCSAALQQLEGVSKASDVMLTRLIDASMSRAQDFKLDVDRLLLEVNTRDLPSTTLDLISENAKISHSGKDPSSKMRNGHSRMNGHTPNGRHSPISPKCIDQHLSIVSEGDLPFVYKHLESGDWILDLRTCRNRLLNAEIFHYVRNRFGVIALRVIKILAEKGKVDEKWLQELGLVATRDLRQALASLHSSGLIELQEIPRDPQRQPNRTMFLWFFDSERAQRILLDETYMAIVKLLKRLKLERWRLRSTIEKTERSDVKGKEEDFLPTEEMSVLKRWRKRERWLLAEINRLDDHVVILCRP